MWNAVGGGLGFTVPPVELKVILSFFDFEFLVGLLNSLFPSPVSVASMAADV